MGRFFGTAVLGRQLHAGNQPGQRVRAGSVTHTMCGVGGWEMWGGGCLRGAVSREGYGKGQSRVSPKLKLKNSLAHPAGLKGMLVTTCCLEAAVWLITSIIKSHASC